MKNLFGKSQNGKASENEIELLKQRVENLEVQLKKMDSDARCIELEEQVDKINKSNKTKYIRQIMEKTGWDYNRAKNMVRTAYRDCGVSCKTYFLNEFYNIPREEQPEAYKKIVADKKRAKEEKREAKNEMYLNMVIEATGWSREHAVKEILAARERNGASYEHYAVYGFWDLSEKEQDTYFTKGDARKLSKLYNTNKKLIRIFMDKDLFLKNFDQFIGRPWIATDEMEYDTFKQKFASEKKIIYKPISSSGGKGIEVFELNKDNRKAVFSQLKEYPRGIIEGFVNQHPMMKKLSVNSVNTIRVVTVQTYNDIPGVEKGKVHFLYAGIRMGCGDSYVDNLHSGGMMANVDIDTGVVVTPAVDFNRNSYTHHPETGEKILGFKVPYFDEIKKLIVSAYGSLPGYYGWDIAITENGPIVIEVNTAPGAVCLQSPFVPEKKGMRHVIAKFLGEGAERKSK